MIIKPIAETGYFTVQADYYQQLWEEHKLALQ